MSELTLYSQRGTPYLRETIALYRQVTDEKQLFRLDSGNCAATSHGTIIKYHKIIDSMRYDFNSQLF